jgi:putative MFS transporter
MVLLPAQLRDAGMAGSTASSMLANSALYAAPALIAVVLLYAGWNARSALALFIGLMALALFGFAYWTTASRGPGLATVCIGTLVISLTAVNAMLLPYSADIYPTAVRATGTGLVAGATKLGGVLGPSAMLLVFHLGGNGLRAPSLVLAAGCVTGLGVLLKWGPRLRRANLPRREQPVEAAP